MSTILVGAPGARCFIGVQHSGTFTGRVEDLGGLNTYISELPAAVHVVVFTNVPLGFVVLSPDYFFGDAVPNHQPGRDRNAWLQSVRASASEAFPKWLDADKAIYGYCFSAPFVMDLAAVGFVVTGVIVHPAFLEESHFEKLDSGGKANKAKKEREFHDITVATKSTYHFQFFFSGVKHGFAVRGNPDIPQERWFKEESARGIKEWFTRFAA
ncbi:hypothetical protein BDN67DRAFT_991787 [Paxillus ammoniavirescens]|nr:hypothetical protein BDN67DRAFT_991787 [Paxillus ammoniavirescens]